MAAKIEWHQGELHPCIGFTMTNLTRPNPRVVKFYNGRDAAERNIERAMNDGNPTGEVRP